MHILQPLDVGLFSPLQRPYRSELDLWMRRGGNAIKNGQFYEYYTQFYDTITVYINLIPDL